MQDTSNQSDTNWDSLLELDPEPYYATYLAGYE